MLKQYLKKILLYALVGALAPPLVCSVLFSLWVAMTVGAHSILQGQYFMAPLVIVFELAASLIYTGPVFIFLSFIYTFVFSLILTLLSFACRNFIKRRPIIWPSIIIGVMTVILGIFLYLADFELNFQRFIDQPTTNLGSIAIPIFIYLSIISPVIAITWLIKRSKDLA